MDMYDELAYDNYCYNVLWTNVEKYQMAYDNQEHINKAWEDAYWYMMATYKIIDISDTFADMRNKITKVVPIYDKTSVYTNCTVEVRTNSETGETSISWARSDETEEIEELDEEE